MTGKVLRSTQEHLGGRCRRRCSSSLSSKSTPDSCHKQQMAAAAALCSSRQSLQSSSPPPASPAAHGEDFENKLIIICRDKRPLIINASPLADKSEFLRDAMKEGNSLHVDEDSRIVERMISLLHDINRVPLSDDLGNLRKGIEGILISLLGLADSWKAKHVRDHLACLFVDNFDRIYKYCERRKINPFLKFSCQTIKIVVMPLLSRLDDRECLEEVLHQIKHSSELKCRQEKQTLRKVFDLLEDKLDDL